MASYLSRIVAIFLAWFCVGVIELVGLRLDVKVFGEEVGFILFFVLYAVFHVGLEKAFLKRGIVA